MKTVIASLTFLLAAATARADGKGDTAAAPVPEVAKPAAPAASATAPAAGSKSDPTKATGNPASDAKDSKQAKPAATPSLAPGAVGELALLQKQFPAMKSASKPDGTLIVDGRFAVTGKGTLAEPFVVSWDHLTSASEVYDPRKGQKKIPDHVQMLDGQYVTVTGYVAFPIYVKEPKEMLSMLNQWDGCCIGIPPTPYDAIEVHLKDVATKEQRMATFGTVTGRLSVKPYLVGDWLVGLYVMDDAAVSKPKQGGTGT